MNKQIIYEFLYNSCIHESAAATMSLHRTREGAERALEEHKAKERENHKKMIEFDPINYNDNNFGEHEDWYIGEKELMD